MPEPRQFRLVRHQAIADYWSSRIASAISFYTRGMRLPPLLQQGAEFPRFLLQLPKRSVRLITSSSGLSLRTLFVDRE